MAENFVLAADLGGTNLRTAVVSDKGSILYQREISTPRSAQARDLVSVIADEARSCIASTGSAPSAFCLAVAALVDSTGQNVLSSPNLPQLNGALLAAEISKHLDITVLLENDATAAAIGEHWLGASANAQHSICVTLGTGVGGGLILNAEPFRGASGTAGEIGHICVEPDGVDCGCGSHGCLEQYSSATAIVRIARELSRNDAGSKLHSLSDFSSADVYEAGLKGDASALETFRQAGRYLGIALTDLINVLNPEIVVIGGGAAGAWDLFIKAVQNEIRLRAFKQPAAAAKIVRAELGNNAGILGAAWVAHQTDRLNLHPVESLS